MNRISYSKPALWIGDIPKCEKRSDKRSKRGWQRIIEDLIMLSRSKGYNNVVVHTNYDAKTKSYGDDTSIAITLNHRGHNLIFCCDKYYQATMNLHECYKKIESWSAFVQSSAHFKPIPHA